MPIYEPRLDTTVAEPESDVLTVPDIIPEIDDPGAGSGEYRVVLYDDDWHPIDQVIEQVVKACECGKLKAIKITLEAHKKGRAVCYKGSRAPNATRSRRCCAKSVCNAKWTPTISAFSQSSPRSQQRTQRVFLQPSL